MKRIIQNLLGCVDFQLVRKSNFERLVSCSAVTKLASLQQDFNFLKSINPDHRGRCVDLFGVSPAQLRQDLFALCALDFKVGGYFVEFGATNGLALSNTLLMEKHFGWSGILAEPARRWHEELRKNRSVHIETSCVWRESGRKLGFNETDIGEYSTIDDYSGSDMHAGLRVGGSRYEVETISLIDLLRKYGAPSTVDYLSIDTEGSEYEILKAIDFEQYRFRVITCEHNFTPAREKVFDLLSEHGYVRKFEHLSCFDDWYVCSSL